MHAHIDVSSIDGTEHVASRLFLRKELSRLIGIMCSVSLNIIKQRFKSFGLLLYFKYFKFKFSPTVCHVYTQKKRLTKLLNGRYRLIKSGPSWFECHPPTSKAGAEAESEHRVVNADVIKGLPDGSMFLVEFLLSLLFVNFWLFSCCFRIFLLHHLSIFG